MEVKAGYKQTDAGIMPQDWDCQSLEEITDPKRPICYGIVQVGAFVRNGIPVLAIKNLNTDYLANIHRSSPKIETPYMRSRVRPGDVLISVKGSTGRIGLVPPHFQGNISRDIARLSLTDQNDPGFWFQMLQSETARRNLGVATVGTTRMELSIGILKRVRMPRPPRQEQHAIGAALSDVDALLGSLDRLIAKKRDATQGAIQQLLTGQTRLPGFRGRAQEKPLGHVIGALDAGVSVNSVEGENDAANDGKCILKTSSVVCGKFLPEECKRITVRDLQRARLNPRRDTLLISRMNTPDLVGECGYVDRDYPNLFVPDRLWLTRFRPEADVNARWLGYVLSTPLQRRRIGAAATGTSGSMKNLSKQAFLSLEVTFPPGEEQAAIAAVLSDMDAEIAALEQRRDKTRLLKQGMMQELLTGRTRLV